jgi:protein TonB
MLGGFDPRSEKLFFQRRYGHASLAALVVAAAVAGWAASQDRADAVVEVELQPEIEDFAVEEEKPEEEEPPPPPPPDVEVKVTQKPKPKPKIKPPDQKPLEAAPETKTDKVYEHPGGPTSSGGIGTTKVDKPKPPAPKPAAPKPEAKPKPASEPIDPTKPIDRPEKATMPKPDGGNKPPAYPESLRDAGITGEVVVKIHIHRDGTIKGAKILRKKSSATTEEEKAAAEKAFVAAVIAAVRTWKYEPAKLDGEPISIWFPVTLPFTLTGG